MAIMQYLVTATHAESDDRALRQAIAKFEADLERGGYTVEGSSHIADIVPIEAAEPGEGLPFGLEPEPHEAESDGPTSEPGLTEPEEQGPNGFQEQGHTEPGTPPLGVDEGTEDVPPGSGEPPMPPPGTRFA